MTVIIETVCHMLLAHRIVTYGTVVEDCPVCITPVLSTAEAPVLSTAEAPVLSTAEALRHMMSFREGGATTGSVRGSDT